MWKRRVGSPGNENYDHLEGGEYDEPLEDDDESKHFSRNRKTCLILVILMVGRVKIKEYFWHREKIGGVGGDISRRRDKLLSTSHSRSSPPPPRRA
jgi:hypothetical protein